MLQLRLGSIYNIYYSQWKSNIKVIAFVLYPGMAKTHILNLAAVQLSTVDRLQITNIIKRLSAVKSSSSYGGAMLYNIFKTYAPQAVKKCYRTIWKHNITEGALINYGLNDKDSFTDLDLIGNSKKMIDQVKNDFIVNSIDLITGNGVKERITDKFAKPIINPSVTPPPVIPVTSQNTTITQPLGNTTTIVTPEPAKTDNQNNTDVVGGN